MAYKTGDVAKMVGLTTQTLRDYENHGLLEAEKDTETGYRYFSGQMVSKAIAIRSLRNLGFSLPEVGNLLQKMDYETYCNRFDDILRRQEAALEKQRLLCNLAREQLTAVQNIRDTLHVCRLEENVQMCCLDYLCGESPLLKTKQELAVMNQWTEYSMFTRNYSPLYAETPPNMQVMGLAISREMAEKLDLPIHAPVYTRSYPLVISMMGKHSVELLPGDEELRYIREFAESNRLRLLGEAFLVSRFTYWEEDKEICCSMLYYPVEKCE